MSTLAATYARLSQKTADDLKTIAASPNIAELSSLTLPEIERLSEQIAQVVPAGNVPGLILSGLVRLEGRQVPRTEQQRHLGLLFRGARDLLDKAVYGAMFAGPAAVIMAYQKLLRLAGKDLDAAFPDGTWQFYLEFALREDTARHANETTGFQHSLAAHRIALTDSDALAAWMMAALITIQGYDRLLENEWRERVYTALLRQCAGGLDAERAAAIHGAYAAWERQRPYVRGQDAGHDDYSAYRRHKFNEFLAPLVEALPNSTRTAFVDAVTDAERESLPAYIRQMSILARLEPGAYQETRVPYPLEQAQLAVIYQGAVTLIRVPQPPDGDAIRGVAAALLSKTASQPPGDLDLLLARTARAVQPDLIGKVDGQSRESLAALSVAPIILNWDRRDARQPLAVIRQGRRGVGDHALTLFFTDISTVFDQSHIFFDGAWGAALAEIMTGEALSWALYFSQLPPAAPSKSIPRGLTMTAPDDAWRAGSRARLPAEASAESTGLRLNPVMTLRRLFKSRSDLVSVTVNDLLILYRAIHGQRYVPSPNLMEKLAALEADPRAEIRAIYTQIDEALDRVRRTNPAILIPMDASQASPRERLYPTTFRNPMHDLLDWHDSALESLHAYKTAHKDRGEAYARFDECQRRYLRMLAGFGELMRKYKEIALSGQSTSTMSIKMLAHMPDPVQRLLDQIPGQFDVLNEIIKGEEVFSNVGRVAKGSTLRRFITAKDDNRQKTLAWGVVTDDQDIVHISLRDFRPHVTVLYENGLSPLADLIAQDFLDSYVDGFNLFVRELREITVASRETQYHKTPPTDQSEQSEQRDTHD
jgi:hypothetical protein